MGIYLHAGWGSEQGDHNHNYYDLDHNNNHYHLDHNLNHNYYHSKSQLSKSCPQLQLLRSWWSMMRVNCRLIRRETSKNGRYWTHRWASLQTSRSSFLGRFWVGTRWIKDHLFWFWVPKDWSNIILSWRTSFRNVHSGMSTALHRANWVQQNLTSRKCSSTLFIYFDASLIITLKVMCNDKNDTRYRLNHVFGLCEDPSSMPREEELASRYSLSLVLVLVFS